MDYEEDAYFQMQIEEAIKLSTQKSTSNTNNTNNSQESAFFTDDNIFSSSQTFDRKENRSTGIANNKYGGLTNSSTVRTGYASRPVVPQKITSPIRPNTTFTSSSKLPDRSYSTTSSFSSSNFHLTSNAKPSSTSSSSSKPTINTITNTTHPKCHKCLKPITTGQYVSAMDRHFHPACFTCHRCHKQISLTDPSFVPYGTPPHPFHAVCAQDELNGDFLKKNHLSSSSECFHCKKPFSVLTAVTGFLTAGGRQYHPGCFRCAACQQPLGSSQVFTQHGEPPLPYHPHCAEQLFSSRCSLCSQVLKGQCFRHPFFEDEVYCKETSHENRRTCCSCQRREPFKAGSGFRELQDGRVLCGVCSTAAALDRGSAVDEGTRTAQRLYGQVVDFMERKLGLPIPNGMRDVPVLAVDLTALNENRHNACTASHNSPTVRGLTLSSRGEIRQYMHTLHPSGVPALAPVEVSVQETRDVSAVLVLCGLPRDLTAAILAHEAMHVWLKLSRHMPFDLQSKVEEGMCQVISHKFLEELSAGSHDSRTCEQLRAFYRHQIVNDPSPIYGDGFRAASQCEKTLGLDIVLEHLALTKQLPTC